MKLTIEGQQIQNKESTAYCFPICLFLPLIIASKKYSTKKQDNQILMILDLETLFSEVISQPLNNHVALSRSNRFFIDAKNKSLPSFLYCYTSRSLQNKCKSQLSSMKSTNSLD